jgi:hypothetical protein
MKILYKEKAELRIQVKSFCPYVQSCPFISLAMCSECFSYYVRFEKHNGMEMRHGQKSLGVLA